MNPPIPDKTLDLRVKETPLFLREGVRLSVLAQYSRLPAPMFTTAMLKPQVRGCTNGGANLNILVILAQAIWKMVSTIVSYSIVVVCP